MSKASLTLVSVTGAASLQAFASSVATKAGASLNVSALQQGGGNVAIGSKAPEGVHTAVTQLTGAGSGAYKGVQTTLIRAVLPTGEGPVAVRDAVDVLPAAGISHQAEIAAAKASFAKTATEAVNYAKGSASKKITVAVKQQTKFNNLNELFQDAVNEAAATQGVTVDFLSTATVSNQMIMFPEQLGVVATADTPTADNIEGMFAGLLGGVSRKYIGDDSSVQAGNSAFSVARAVAGALAASGASAEAKKIEDAVSKAKVNDTASILGAL
eukprot:161391_1